VVTSLTSLHLCALRTSFSKQPDDTPRLCQSDLRQLSVLRSLRVLSLAFQESFDLYEDDTLEGRVLSQWTLPCCSTVLERLDLAMPRVGAYRTQLLHVRWHWSRAGASLRELHLAGSLLLASDTLL
jgi:hypothetical protein